MDIAFQARQKAVPAVMMLLLTCAVDAQPVSAFDNGHVIGETPEAFNVPVQNPLRYNDIKNDRLDPPAMLEAVPTPKPEPMPKQRFDVPPASNAIPSLMDHSSPIVNRNLSTNEINQMLDYSPPASSSVMSAPVGSSYTGNHLASSEYITHEYPETEACVTCVELNPQRFWVAADVMGLFLQGDQVPALVTTSPAGTAQGVAGRLGAPTTSTLFGGDRMSQNLLLGGRASVGRWLKNAEDIAVEAEVMFMQEDRETTTFTSPGVPILARPFFDNNPAVNAPNASIVAFNPLVSGTLNIDTRSEIFGGSFGMRRVNFLHTDPCNGKRAEFLTGFRYFRLSESLRMTDNRTVNGNFNDVFGNFTAGDTLSMFDSFKTHNDFFGFDFGTHTTRTRGRWTFDMLAKVAIGVNNQRVEVDGSRTITTGGAAVVSQGGLLTNNLVGVQARQRFAVLPEFRLSTTFQVTNHLQARVGYQFMLLSDVVRPGGQIDRTINSTMLDPAIVNAGVAQPNLPFRSDTVFLHGATAGLEFRF